jgi:hypothetical protein
MDPSVGTIPYYLPFINSLIERLDWKPDPDQMLWHYTGGTGLMGIVESGTIFATQVSSLNDATEIRYSAMRLRDALTKILAEMNDDQPALIIMKKYLELLQDDDASPNSVALPYFVSCFSSLEDDLSQWRSYGGGENGYAIGIFTKDLFGATNSLVARVNYDPDLHMKLADEAARATIRFYEEGLKMGIENWENQFLLAWDSALTQLAPLAKDPGFSVEKEVRVIDQLQGYELGQLKVLQRKTMMSRHLPMKFPASGQTSRVPISRVIIGPCRHREITRVSVDTLLRAHGYQNVSVVSSQRPYQEM